MNFLNKLTEITAKTFQPLTDTTSFVNQNITTVNRYLESFVPISTTSQFISKGTLTPEEFVIAGNGLIMAGWRWEQGNTESQKAYLPSEKQFLLLTGVKSIPQFDFKGTYDESEINEDHCSLKKSDVSVYNQTLIQEEDVPFRAEEPIIEDSHLFEMSVVYDRYYRTPRVFITGTNFEGTPLDPETVLSYVSPQHANKTITIEYHPHLGNLCVSIHPCMHPQTMKRFIGDYLRTQQEFNLKIYMILFLKFISCILPSLKYDTLYI